MIGGGLPIGAVVGKAELMAELDSSGGMGLEHGGTFSGNPLSMVAGAAALDCSTKRRCVGSMHSVSDSATG